jgi:hypothetical protein
VGPNEVFVDKVSPFPKRSLMKIDLRVVSYK